MACVGAPVGRTASPLSVRTESLADDDGLSAFVSVRPRLFGIAYRMLGSATEAEDIVQDAWLRWQCTNRRVIVNASAYLATTTTRLCINAVTSAHARRETYVGRWLPEPVDTSADPALVVEHEEAMRLAVLVLLEKLSPTERAAYVLHEAFDYPYSQIAEVLRLEEANTRQLVTRARKHVAAGRRAPVSLAERRRLLGAFLQAARQGDMSSLEGLFAEDVTSYTNGLVGAGRDPDCGRGGVAEFISPLASHFWADVKIEWMEQSCYSQRKSFADAAVRIPS
jgi:RNA polymerase sigma-70 factor, ECF subfamily